MNSPLFEKEEPDVLLNVNDDKLYDSKEKYFFKDKELIKLQENLFMMGFDINMINKVITHFNVRT